MHATIILGSPERLTAFSKKLMGIDSGCILKLSSMTTLIMRYVSRNANYTSQLGPFQLGRFHAYSFLASRTGR